MKTIIFINIFFLNIISFAQWNTEIPLNICINSNIQNSPNSIVTNYYGSQDGFIVTWIDRRDNGVYAQKINTLGNFAWTTDGVKISNIYESAEISDYRLTYPQLISDNEGGAIIFFVKSVNSVNWIFAQRISHSGTLLWRDEVQISSVYPGVAPRITITSENAIMITWESPFGNGIYVNQINFNGAKTWELPNREGQLIYERLNFLYDALYPTICADGQGNAIITWLDARNYETYIYDIYGTSVFADGYINLPEYKYYQNSADGEKSVYPNTLYYHNAVTSTDGVILTHQTRNLNISARKIFTQGGLLWETTICNDLDPQKEALIISDGENGAIISWKDLRNPQNSDIYAKRINSDGQTIWGGTDGVKMSYGIAGNVINNTNDVVNNPFLRYYTLLLFTWENSDLEGDYRSLATGNSVAMNPPFTITKNLSVNFNSSLQHINGLRVAFYEKDNNIYAIQVLDHREVKKNGSNQEIEISAFPNPFNPSTSFNFKIENESIVTLKIFDITGKEVAVLLNQSTLGQGNHSIPFNAGHLASGVYFYRIEVENLIKIGKLLLVK